MDTKARYYATHLMKELLPSLQIVRQQIIQLETDIAEYETVVDRLQLVLERNARKSTKVEETLMELGAGVYVDAQVQDTSVVSLDIGLDIHVDLPIEDAIVSSSRRITLLKKKRERLQVKEKDIVWQIKQFQSAIDQVKAGDPSSNGVVNVST